MFNKLLISSEFTWLNLDYNIWLKQPPIVADWIKAKFQRASPPVMLHDPRAI